MTYSQAVEYIINVPRFNKYIDGNHKANATLVEIMKKLGNPHLKVKTIHVAGTNGKGSTVQLVKNILVEAGYKVGCFVSPHLIKINERISVWESLDTPLEETYINDVDFLEAFNKVEKAYESTKKGDLPSLTFFEYVFAIATVYFETKELDYCIYETGLGGRLDATNILKPEITAITSIGLDHMKLLGNTIEQIAFEKAGIIKQGVPIVYNTGDVQADRVIEECAKLMDAVAYNVAISDYIINEFTSAGIDFSCSNGYYKYQNVKLSSQGLYQVQNALTAIEICNRLKGMDAPISDDIIRNACGKFYWQGRMEKLEENIFLDGAHNLDAIVPFTNSANKLCNDKKNNILFAVADDKNYRDMIEYLCNNLKIDNIYVTSIQSERRVLSKEVAEIFKASLLDSSKTNIYYDNDLKKTFSMAYNKSRETNDMLYCVGSLYLIGAIKELYMEEYKDD